MAGVAGLEPVTSAVTGQRSNQLSYTPAETKNYPTYPPAVNGEAVSFSIYHSMIAAPQVSPAPKTTIITKSPR